MGEVFMVHVTTVPERSVESAMLKQDGSISLLGSLDEAVVESTVDGPGYRLVLFVAGCAHRCAGCHNPHSWEIADGLRYPVDQVVQALTDRLRAGPYAGLTLSGGDPLFQPAATAELLEGLRRQHPELNIWCYTGYRYEQVQEWSLLRQIDVLVDGPYVASMKRPSKPFRGSANQRLLYLDRGQIIRQESRQVTGPYRDIGRETTALVMTVIKRDGRTVQFESSKITRAMEKAFVATEGQCPAPAELNELTDAVVARLPEGPSVEEIQDQVEAVLMEAGHHAVAKRYMIYRQERTAARHRKERLHQLVGQIVRETGRENANVGRSPSAKLLQMAEAVGREFMERELTDPAVRQAIAEGLLYPHDYAWGPIGTTTCCFIPLGKLLASGFDPGHGWVRTPRRIRTAAQLSMIILQSNQNDQHGGQAFGWYDRDLAPYVRLEYEWQLARIQEDLAAVGVAGDSVSQEQLEKLAWERTRSETFQAMEGVVFNANTMHSRAGAQVPFVSINLGTDTSREGRLITETLLLAYEKGLGHGEQPIFPNLIFKVKKGVNFEPGDPNYDLLQLSLRVTAKRLFPNYVFQDASFNAAFPGDVPTMGCRTRVAWNMHKPDDGQTCEGRGNISFTTLNLVGMALKARREMQADGFSALAARYDVVLSEGTDLPQVRSFFCLLNEYADLAIRQLHQRFQYQSSFRKSDFPFLLNGVWMNSEKLAADSSLEQVWRHGTLSMGFIGLAETLVALIGRHHGESEVADALGVQIVRFLRAKTDEAARQYQLNYSLLATPAEGLTGKLAIKDRATWGEIPGVTDKEWYTNSYHVPVEYPCSAFHKIRVEGKYHAYCNAGHISYVELNEAPQDNPEALMALLKYMSDQDMGYVAFNYPVDRCRHCGEQGLIDEDCPSCGSSDISRIRRITGYLAELTNFNEAKRAETQRRRSHWPTH